MSWLRPWRVSRPTSPEQRRSHESALVDDHLYFFGGWDESKLVPRHEILVKDVRNAEKRWDRRFTQGKPPPPSVGARCVVIDKMIYSYGGRTEGGFRLGIVYRLDPKKMEWIEVATPIAAKKPHERSECCLCAIGSRMIWWPGRVIFWNKWFVTSDWWQVIGDKWLVTSDWWQVIRDKWFVTSDLWQVIRDKWLVTLNKCFSPGRNFLEYFS